MLKKQNGKKTSITDDEIYVAILCVVYSDEVPYFEMEKMEADATVIGKEQC